MASIAVDVNRCEGYANCVVAAPQFFDIDEDGQVVRLQAVVEGSDGRDVAEAVRSCPVAAIWLEGA